MPDWILLAAILLAVFFAGRSLIRHRRERFVQQYDFPARVGDAVRARYPHLGEDQLVQVITGLRDYFLVCHDAGGAMVSMPSQVVDVAWHEFILFTRNYQRFCRKGLGRFLHHTPAEAMSSPTLAQLGIKTAWRLACRREHIDHRAPRRLPRLFALDAELEIPDGFTYALRCGDRPGEYCAGHIGCGSCGGGGGDSGCGGGCGGD